MADTLPAPTRLLRSSVVAGVLAIALAGCFGGSNGGGNDGAEPEETPTAAPTEESQVQPIEFPDADELEVTAPGTALTFGDVARLPVGDGTEEPTYVDATVLALIPAEESFWEDTFSNPEDFEGQQPTLIAMQLRWPGDDGTFSTPIFNPFLADGTEASLVQSLFNYDICELPEVTFDDAGEELVCLVAASAADTEVTRIEYHKATQFMIFAPTPEENPYYATPVTWSAAP